MTETAPNEWEFTSDVSSWINQILSVDQQLPFGEAKCEQRVKGTTRRRDLTLYDRDRRVALTGEIKLPYQKDGSSPYNEAVVQAARSKAEKAKVDYFFTWNVNECVLWETFPEKTVHQDRKYMSWNVANVTREEHLNHPTTIHAIKHWLPVFLNDVAKIIRGRIQLGMQSPDEKFIEALESSLKMPINLTVEEISDRYKQVRFKSKLDQWMREEQGWDISVDPDDIRDNLDRAAKFTCYALVNKLVFYEALLKRYSARLDKILVPEHLQGGEALRLHLERFFATAKDVTGDYETVFGEDHNEFGNLIPFFSDHAVPHWRNLINQVHHFDFSKLDYEVIGNIFELLISPRERHKYGQYYTRPEVVDLINSFCIHTGQEKIMDPACGGGTFLVRAYVRKRNLCPQRKHGQLLSDLFGVDISHFATHLTTINLATRDLIDEANYPQIARSDFFDVKPSLPFIFLPNPSAGIKIKAAGMGQVHHREVDIPPLDAVIGNPPYVRQEDIPKAKNKKAKLEPGTKEFYADLVKNEWKHSLSGRSDLHCYFWPHAATFLKDNGYLCLLTSSQWLDVDYGFRLQEWMLRNFEIVAIFESVDEPWFVGARVATTITILRRQKDESARMNNTIRFVQLRRPIKELIASDGTTPEILAADEFRNEILELTENTVNQRYRARLVRQGDLWEQGVQLGKIVKQEDEEDEEPQTVKAGEYYGSKWGVYLRAPDLWFDLLDEFSDKFKPLGEFAEVRFGVKTGKDCFFFPKDYSQEALNSYPNATQFKSTFGVPRKDVESGHIKLVTCGEGRGEVRPIEAAFLEPEVHSLMEVDGFTVSAENCSRLILLVDQPKESLKGQFVLDYIRWGEEKGYHTGSTCALRANDNRPWYDLTGHERGAMFWPMAQQYKHAIPTNDHHLICNHNLFDITSKSVKDEVLAGILNSSWVVFSKFQYGRPVGVEGNLKTEVVDVKMMSVPDPTGCPAKVQKRIIQAFDKMKKRKAIYFLSEQRLRRMAYTQAGKAMELEKLSDLCELDMEDRRELDESVLEMLGVVNPKRRKALLDYLYGYLREFFEWTRQKEEKAIVNKKRAKRRGTTSPQDIAAQIIEEVKTKEPAWLRRYDPDFVDSRKPYDVFDLPPQGKPMVYSDMFTPHAVRFAAGRKVIATVETQNAVQPDLVKLVAQTGVRGLVRIPHDETDCRQTTERYDKFLRDREQRFRALVEERTADEEMQDKICEALYSLMGNLSQRH